MEDSEDDVRGPVRHGRKLNIPLPGPASNLPVPVGDDRGTPPTDFARGEIERRIATASLDELPALVQARGAIIDQDEDRLDRVHQRRGQLGVFYSKVAFSVAAAVGGTTLVVAGFGLPGFFLLGGAAAVYVPEYVRDVVDRFGKGDGDAR